MSIILQPDTEARLLAAARERGKTPDEVVAPLLDVLPTETGEGDLLWEIGQGFPEAFWNRYRSLVGRRQDETLTLAEQSELIALSDAVEERTVQRARALVELARRRGVPLDTLMQQMGIRPNEHDLVAHITPIPMPDEQPKLREKKKGVAALMDAWREEDQTDDPEELDRRDRELEEFKTNINRWRAEEGRAPAYQ